MLIYLFRYFRIHVVICRGGVSPPTMNGRPPKADAHTDKDDKEDLLCYPKPMQLIGSLTSPFVRKIKIFLLEKNIPFEFILDIPWKESTQVPHYNPLGKVPVLITNDHQPMIDSRVIVDYLEFLQPTPALIPKEFYFQIKQLEALSDGISDAAANCFIEKNMRLPELQSQNWIDRQLSKIYLGVKKLSHDLGDKIYFCGNQFSLADIASACTLGYLDFRFKEITWQTEYPNLKKYFNTLLQRNSVHQTIPTV